MEKNRLEPYLSITSNELITNPDKYFKAVGLRRLTPQEPNSLSIDTEKAIIERLREKLAYPTFLKPKNTDFLSQHEEKKQLLLRLAEQI